jgi:hypothetical protein
LLDDDDDARGDVMLDEIDALGDVSDSNCARGVVADVAALGDVPSLDMTSTRCVCV